MSIYDPSDMSQEEKLAFADQCKVAFQCQASSRASLGMFVRANVTSRAIA